MEIKSTEEIINVGFQKEYQRLKWVSVNSLLNFIEKQINGGNFIEKQKHPGQTTKGFSPGLCLSDILQTLRK